MLPWIQEAHQREPDSVRYLLDCDRCKGEQSVLNRQLMGCGWEQPADPRFPVRPWDHPGRDRVAAEWTDDGKLHLPVCPGYACSLPEVHEASWAHSYWDKGELSQFCEGQATSTLRDCISIYAVEQSRAHAWALKEKSNG